MEKTKRKTKQCSCDKCKGSGIMSYTGAFGESETDVCNKCNGTGYMVVFKKKKKK